MFSPHEIITLPQSNCAESGRTDQHWKSYANGWQGHYTWVSWLKSAGRIHFGRGIFLKINGTGIRA